MKAEKKDLLKIKPIRKPSDFAHIKNTGQKWVSDTLIIQSHHRDMDKTGCFEIGYIITKKIGNAVMRNRIRRRYRSAIAEVLPQKAKPGQYVLIGRKQALHAPADKIRSDLTWCLKRLSSLKED